MRARNTASPSRLRPRPCPSSWASSTGPFVCWHCRSYPPAIPVERDLQRLLDRVDEDELHVTPRLLGELLEVGLVLFRQHHPAQPGPLGGEDLLAYAADREDASGQRQLPGHPQVAGD